MHIHLMILRLLFGVLLLNQPQLPRDGGDPNQPPPTPQTPQCRISDPCGPPPVPGGPPL